MLIISPYFPPVNAADMQRVRMSLPYYHEFGWEAEVVTVDVAYSDMVQDAVLLQSVPAGVVVHQVKAFSKKLTAKMGLGSIALRSLLFYKRKVNQLLQQKPYDLIYFSTTQFPVCILGAYWKKKFGVPYIIDMQDPWLTDYYEDKPKQERPPKYWAAHRINKTLEPIAMKQVDGLIAVSKAYLDVLGQRYANCKQIPQQTIPFGAFATDFAIARKSLSIYPSVLPKAKETINVVYIGRGGKDMADATRFLFQAFSQGLKDHREVFKRIHFYFIGTSYAAAGKGASTILPVAQETGVGDFVTELTDRIPFYQTLNTLADADALFIPGSNDPQYTASKIYPYVLAQKPLLAIFHPASSVVSFLKDARAGEVLTFDEKEEILIHQAKQFLFKVLSEGDFIYHADENILNKYSSKTMTKMQCELFDNVIQVRRKNSNKRVL